MIPKAEVEEHGVDIDNIDILDVLKNYGLPASEVASKLGITQPAASVKLKKWMEEGKITRRKYNGTYHYYAV